MKLCQKILIDRGWSGDTKYRAVDAAGKHYFLRISKPAALPRHEAICAAMQKLDAMGVPLCTPVEVGLCEEGAYTLQNWVEGCDARDMLPTLSRQAQYRYGWEAGKYLTVIHSLPAPEDAIPWAQRFGRKTDRKIALYENCPLHYEKGELFLAYARENRHLLTDRPQTFQHGDYHSGNMMFDENGRLIIIDFDKADHGDPWEEFNRIVWCVADAPAFAAGMVDGYFAGDPPEEFWRLLAFYITSNTLSSLPWAIPFGEKEIETMRAQARDVLSWYDDFTRVIPRWYEQNSDLQKSGDFI